MFLLVGICMFILLSIYIYICIRICKEASVALNPTLHMACLGLAGLDVLFLFCIRRSYISFLKCFEGGLHSAFDQRLGKFGAAVQSYAEVNILELEGAVQATGLQMYCATEHH